MERMKSIPNRWTGPQVKKENKTEVKSPVIVTNPAIQKRFI
ncbi:MAG TPA: hypothetical protein VLA74_02895 [Nitrososphaeraceae archaeon]|nr:hypothetical protein [Nitrososphaeraceae archaeon]